MVGTNNVEKVYYGKQQLESAQQDISSLFNYLKNRFGSADFCIVNILPRSVKGKNDVIRFLNLHIKKYCEENGDMQYVDTEERLYLFTDNVGRRRQNYFQRPNSFTRDNVHLNRMGIKRLGGHLKYVAHKL